MRICELIFLCLTFMYFNFLYKETIARVVLCCVALTFLYLRQNNTFIRRFKTTFNAPRKVSVFVDCLWNWTTKSFYHNLERGSFPINN